ncbi:MAG: PH domain-containing protein [Spirochaetales bacterium]|nr:PH domain-containing protein [Spirochaetales bacterium]
MAAQKESGRIKSFFLTLCGAMKSGCLWIARSIAAVIDRSIKPRFTRFVSTLKDINIYRHVREHCIYRYLSTMMQLEKSGTVITWQPFYLILVKTIIAVTVFIFVFNLYPYLSGWLGEIVRFFRLHEIYHFDFPTRSSLDTAAQVIIALVLGYIGLFFLIYHIQALFSSLVINNAGKKAYYIRNSVVCTSLYVFSVPEIDHIVLKQNILFRLLGIGTIVFMKKSGEKVTIASIKNASKVFRQFSSIIGENDGSNKPEGRYG